MSDETAAGTVEYAVQCEQGLMMAGDPLDVLERWVADHPTGPCGPHRVVQRTVSDWSPVGRRVRNFGPAERRGGDWRGGWIRSGWLRCVRSWRGGVRLWWPVAPECCGQCGAGQFAETWSNRYAEVDVLVEFTCSPRTRGSEPIMTTHRPVVSGIDLDLEAVEQRYGTAPWETVDQVPILIAAVRSLRSELAVLQEQRAAVMAIEPILDDPDYPSRLVGAFCSGHNAALAAVRRALGEEPL